MTGNEDTRVIAIMPMMEAYTDRIMGLGYSRHDVLARTEYRGAKPSNYRPDPGV